MANRNHLKVLRQGVHTWNRWRQANSRIRPNLKGVDLSAEDLSDADLSETDLGAAILVLTLLGGANLSRANLSRADLEHAVLSRANCTEADFSFTNLRRAELAETQMLGADLRDANFLDAILREADLRGSKMGNTNLANIDLSRTRGLESVQHFGRSEISISSIYLSHGSISETFLRRTGVPDNFIEHMRSLSAQNFNYPSCFISYSTQNTDFAQRLSADLEANGVRCWYAPEDLKIGDKFRRSIDEAVRSHDKLLVVLSNSSVKSSWVENEVEAAFEKEKITGKGMVLLPIRIDEAVMTTDQAWAADIRRTRHIGDFSEWKDQNRYRRALDRLLRDLKENGR